MTSNISIIVPARNEAASIQPFLLHLRENAPGAEIIVVDGGSSDGTAGLARGVADLVLNSRPGRAVQMNEGAAYSERDILWFLHADVQVPPNCLQEIDRLLSHKDTVGGFFRIRLPRSPFIYRLTDSLAHYLGLLFRMRCGDHGIFCRRSTFIDLDGFRDVPLMEDAEFFRRLYKRGNVAWSECRLTVSPRRYEEIGALRLTFFYGYIGALYAIGVSLRRLARVYSRFCQKT
jgi:rSAM/selenodomain-associated transferase 2